MTLVAFIFGPMGGQVWEFENSPPTVVTSVGGRRLDGRYVRRAADPDQSAQSLSTGEEVELDFVYYWDKPIEAPV